MDELRKSVEVSMREAFLTGYFDDALGEEDRQPVFLSSVRTENEGLLFFYELDKALYELNYELNNRPDWIDVPLDGIRCLLKQNGID
jgi:predicted trehalose synthase